MIDANDWQNSAVETDYEPWWDHGSSGAGCTDPFDYLELVSDPLWNRVMRLHHFNGTACSPQYHVDFAAATYDKVWVRHVARISTNWDARNTTNGTGASYKWSHVYSVGGGVTTRHNIGFVTQLTMDTGWGPPPPGKSFTEVKITQPAGTTVWGTGGPEGNIWTSAIPDMQDSEWYEFIHCQEIVSTYVGRCRFWRRQITTGDGALIDPQGWFMIGWTYTSNPADTHTFPQVNGCSVGVNRNGGPDEDMYIDRACIEAISGGDPYGIDSHV